MFELTWSIIVTKLLQVAHNPADTVWLGRLSTDAVATISLVFPLIFLLISVGDGFVVAGSTLVAQYTGTKSKGSAGTVVGQMLTFITVIAVVIGVIDFFATDAMLDALPSSEATTGQVIPLAGDYMRVFFLGLPFLFGFFVFSTLMHGYGNTRILMVVMFISAVINVVIGPVSISGFDTNPLFSMLGVEGSQASLFAATDFDDSRVAGTVYITVLSRAIATVIGIYVIFGTNAGPDVQLADSHSQFEHIRQIVDIGVSSAIRQSTTAPDFIAFTAMVVTFNPEVVAASGLDNRLTSFVFLPVLGLGRATNTIVGQNLGVQKPGHVESAVRLAAKVDASVILVTGILAYIFTESIVASFLQAGAASVAQTIDLGVEYIRTRAVEFDFIGVLQVILGAYHDMENAKTAFGFSFFALWLDRTPVVYLLSLQFDFAETGIWLGMTAGQILGAIAATAWSTCGM